MLDERPRDAASAVCDILALVWQIVHQCSLPGCQTEQMQAPQCCLDALDVQQLVRRIQSVCRIKLEEWHSLLLFLVYIPRQKLVTPPPFLLRSALFVDLFRDLNHVEPSDGKRTVSNYGSG
jgi:hypothetical protein